MAEGRAFPSPTSHQQRMGNQFSAPLLCVNCRSLLPVTLRCEKCDSAYHQNQYGYLEMLTTRWNYAVAADDYIHEQEHSGLRQFQDCLLPLLSQASFQTVLDVGCGMGQGVRQLASAGLDAFGVDLPSYGPSWSRAGLDSRRFICADACKLPFTDNFFDVVYSLGVIEHIGTVLGHCTLAADYQEKRQAYARELLRVTKEGGRIFIACPNKTFPVDVQHGPTDDASPRSPIRSFICGKTGLNVHKVSGRYHLLSYSEAKRLFRGCKRFKAPPLRGYFGFGKFQSGVLKPFGSLAKWYVDSLPEPLRASPLNPYLLAEITK